MLKQLVKLRRFIY